MICFSYRAEQDTKVLRATTEYVTAGRPFEINHIITINNVDGNCNTAIIQANGDIVSGQTRHLDFFFERPL